MKKLVILLAILSIFQSGYANAESIIFVGNINSCKPFLGEHDKNIEPELLISYLNKNHNLWSLIDSEKSIHFCGQKAADKYYSFLLKNKMHELTVAEFLLSTSVIIPSDDINTGISRSVLHEENYMLGQVFLLQNSIKPINDSSLIKKHEHCNFIKNNINGHTSDDKHLLKNAIALSPYDYLKVSVINRCAAKIYAKQKDQDLEKMKNKIHLLLNERLLLYVFKEGDKFEFYLSQFFKRLTYTGNPTAHNLKFFLKRIAFFETHWDLISKENQPVVFNVMEDYVKRITEQKTLATELPTKGMLSFFLKSMHQWVSFKKQAEEKTLDLVALDKYIDLARTIRNDAVQDTTYNSEMNRLSILEQAIYDYGLKNRTFNNKKYAEFYTSIIENGYGMKIPDCFQSHCFKVMPAIQDYYLYVANSDNLLKVKVDQALIKLKKQQCKGMRSLHAQGTDDIAFDYPCETILKPLKPSALTISSEKDE